MLEWLYSQQKQQLPMPEPLSGQLIVKGTTSSGHTFRPSDWAERLAGILSTFGLDSRINYSPYVHPTSIKGVKCIVVDSQLEQIDSRAWGFIMGFAKDNDLVVEPHTPD
jgi:hypothetical protein